MRSHSGLAVELALAVGEPSDEPATSSSARRATSSAELVDLEKLLVVGGVSATSMAPRDSR